MLATRVLSRLTRSRAASVQLTFRSFSSEAPVASTSADAIAEDFGVIASVPLSQLTENDHSKFFPFAKETQDKFVPEGINKRVEAMFDLVGHRHLMLREPTQQILSTLKNWETAKETSSGAYVIDGDRGCGKTVALQQIVQFARESDWLVLYVPSARAWCVDAPYVIPSPYVDGKYDVDAYGIALLENFLHCHGDQLRTIPLRRTYGDRYYPESFAAKPKDAAEYDVATLTLRDLVVNGIRDEELACAAVVDLRAELATVTEFPVLIAVDEYNTWFGKTVFGYDGVDVKPTDISVVDALTDIRETGLVPDRKLANGLFVAAMTENFPTRTHFKQQIDYRAHRTTMRPYTAEELATTVAYYNQVHFLHDKPTDAQLAYFRLMTKSVPLSVFDRASFS